MADTYVSFSKEKYVDSFTTFKSFPEPNSNPDPFQIDQRDIEELRNKPSTNPVEKTKKLKRNNSSTNSTKTTGVTLTVQCDICNVPISGPIVFDSHTKGKKHQTQLKNMLNKNPQYKAPTYEELCSKKEGPVAENNQLENTDTNMSQTNSNAKPIEPPLIPTKKFNCNMCNISCNSQQMFDNHLAGKKHLMKVKQSHSTNPAPVRTIPDNNPSSSNYCDVCSIQLNSENELSEHLIQKQHQQRVKEAEYCAKEGAEMNINFDDYKIPSTEPEKNSFEYQCTSCNKKFRNKIQLILHLKSTSHTRLINRTNNQKSSQESNRIKNQTKQENIPRENTAVYNKSSSSYRRSNKPLAKSRPFRTQAFPRAQNFPSYDDDFNQQTSQNIFGAFDPNNEATFPPIVTDNNHNTDNNTYYSSYKRPRSYENNSNEYDGFYPKRNHSYNSSNNNNSQNYYPTETNYYPSSTSSSYPWDNNSYPSQMDDYNNQSSVPQAPWEYPTEPPYDQQPYSNPSSAYMNSMHYQPNPPPLPHYEQPPLPNYPPPSSYSHSQNSTFLSSTGNPGNDSYYSNAFGQ